MGSAVETQTNQRFNTAIRNETGNRRVAMLNYLRDVVDSRVGVNSILSQSIQELKIQKFM